MRDYMSPAVEHVTRVIQHPGLIKAGVMKHRVLTFAITATLLVAVSSLLMLAKNSNQAQAVRNDAVTGTTQPSLDTKITAAQGETQPVADGGSTVSDTSNSGGSSSQSNTNVTVNNQSIDVPQNGTVTKTVSNGNGTTTVNVTSSNTSSGSGNSTSTSNLNVTTRSHSKSSSVSSD